MNRIKIGVRLESFGLPLRRALQEAERLGVGGVQVDAAGDLSPTNLSQTGRREFLHLLRSHNLELTALGCPLRHGLDTPENQEPRIDHVRKVMSLSFDLGPRIAIVQAGPIPGRRKIWRRPQLMTDSLATSASTATAPARCWRWRPGRNRARCWRSSSTASTRGSLGVNLDPANLLMHGFDPVRRGSRPAPAHCPRPRQGRPPQRRQPGRAGSAAGRRRHRLAGVPRPARRNRVSRLADRRARDRHPSRGGRGGRRRLPAPPRGRKRLNHRGRQ